MRILGIKNGDYGERHLENVRRHAPEDWSMAVWEAATFYPPVIDYPEDYLPETLPSADLILAFAEHKGVAELLPDIAAMTGAAAVLAPVDNEAWLPRGLARQLHGWLERMDVACATPKPLCSLTEHDYAVARRKRQPYDNPELRAFARHFGQPRLSLTVGEGSRVVEKAEVQRDAVCGCARFAAEGLVGLPVDEAVEKAGLLHHHFPCLASMGIDPDYDDTLMHVSGNLLKEEVAAQLKPYLKERYIRPGTYSKPSGSEETAE